MRADPRVGPLAVHFGPGVIVALTFALKGLPAAVFGLHLASGPLLALKKR